MKTNIRKGCISVVVIALSLNLLIFPSFAKENIVNEEKIITFEQYYATLKNEYAKYDIGFEMTKENGVIYTQEMLDKELSFVKEFVDGIEIVQDIDPEYNKNILNINKNSIIDNVALRSMPRNVDFGFNFMVKTSNHINPTGYCKIYCYGNATLNIQNDNVISINNFTSEQLYDASNFDGISSKSEKAYRNNPSTGWVKATCSGRVNFSEDNMTWRIPYNESKDFYLQDL